MCMHVVNFEINFNMYRWDFDDDSFIATEFARFGCLLTLTFMLVTSSEMSLKISLFFFFTKYMT